MPFLICLLFPGPRGPVFAGPSKRRSLASEKAIFLYHMIYGIAVTGAFGLWAFAVGGSEAWTWFACAAMLHGIYSLSFLELWALADDSYSLAIMEIISRGGGASGPALMQRLEAIGMGEQTSRLDALRAIGLVRQTGDGSFTLTPAGRAAGAAMQDHPASPGQR